MRSKLPLSVIIIFRKSDLNPRLGDVKKSVEFASEVLLIDTGEKPIVDFAKVRNEALRKAKYEWVFFVDSDEVVSKSSVVEIEKIVSENKFDLVFVKRKDIFFGQILHHGETGETKLIRLGKKSQMEFERPVHEVVKIKSSSRVSDSSIILYHDAHQSVEDFFSKIKFYALKEAQFRFGQKRKFNFWEMLFFPIGKFKVNYLFKLGFLDGYRGLIYAIMMSYHSLLVRVYLLEIEDGVAQK